MCESWNPRTTACVSQDVSCTVHLTGSPASSPWVQLGAFVAVFIMLPAGQSLVRSVYCKSGNFVLFIPLVTLSAGRLRL